MLLELVILKQNFIIQNHFPCYENNRYMVYLSGRKSFIYPYQWIVFITERSNISNQTFFSFRPAALICTHHHFHFRTFTSTAQARKQLINIRQNEEVNPRNSRRSRQRSHKLHQEKQIFSNHSQRFGQKCKHPRPKTNGRMSSCRNTRVLLRQGLHMCRYENRVTRISRQIHK